MARITILPSILDATDEDLIPVWGEDDEGSQLPTLDLFLESGNVELVHVGSADSWLITESFARFAVRHKFSAERLNEAMRPGWELRARLEDTLGAASLDLGVIAACERVSAYLTALSAS